MKLLVSFHFLIVISLCLTGITKTESNSMTNWKIEPSFKYDLCCFLNILTGDEFYLTYYQKDYDEFKERITPKAKENLAS